MISDNKMYNLHSCSNEKQTFNPTRISRFDMIWWRSVMSISSSCDILPRSLSIAYSYVNHDFFRSALIVIPVHDVWNDK